MTQPAGSLSATLTTNQSFYFRASPLLCLIDGMSVSCSFFYHARRTWNLKTALKNVAKAKLMLSRPSIADGSAEQQSSSNLRQLQENELFRGILFLLGVLPQAIKLFACTGLFWAKIWAALYLTSFALIETLVLIPQRFFSNLRSSESDADEILRTTTITTRRAENMNRLWQQWYPGIVMLSHVPLVYVFVMLLMHLNHSYAASYLDESQGNPGIPGLIAVAIIIVAILIFYQITPRFYSEEFNVLISSTVLFWCLFSENAMNLMKPKFDQSTLQALQPLAKDRGGRTTMSMYGAMILRMTSLGHSEKYNTRIGRLSFFFYVAIALAYYIAVYEPTGTIKPAWAEYLG